MPETTLAVADGMVQTGRFIIVQAASAGLPMLIDTATGRTWFRISAGADHYAWRPMRYENDADPSPGIA